MEQVVLVIHLILALGIIGLVLIQRSEGGGLGIGGGSGGIGNLATAQGAANALTRITAIFAACFFITSLTLAVLAGQGKDVSAILDEKAPAGVTQDNVNTEKDDQSEPVIPEVPISE